MRQFPGLWLAFLALSTTPICSSQSADPKLLPLVPPEAEIVAGIDSPPPPNQPGSFVLITRKNTIDLNDFFALTGVDGTRIVRHVVFVAMADDAGNLTRHSLLMDGHFDRQHIYQSSVQGGAKVIDYRGVSVAEIQPFARERDDFNEVRWLAILEPDVLVFGTIASVRQELDRHIAGSGADPVLVHRLAHMRHDNETWCVLSAPARHDEIRSTLLALDPKLAGLAGNGDVFAFGTRYRKQLEFEYEVTAASASATLTISESLVRSLTGLQQGSSLLTSEDTTASDHTVRGVVKIPTARFGAWLAQASAHGQGKAASQ